MRFLVLAAVSALLLVSCASARSVNGFEAASTSEGLGRVNELAIGAARLAAPLPPQNSAELMRSLGYLTSNRRGLFDANHDGRYGFVEWLASDFAVYLIYDVAKDGHVLEDEFIQTRCGPNTQPYMSCGLAGAPVMGFSRQHAHEEFERLDHGHKGYLVATDFTGEALSYFRVNDIDRDGYITDAEIAYVATRARRHP